MKENNNQQTNNSEEVNILELFNFFESKIKGGLKVVYTAYKYVFHLVISFIILFHKRILIIGIITLIAFISGYAYDYLRPKVYSSSMIIKPKYDNKYQLVNNVKYYNELIGSEEGKEKLAKILEISKSEIKEIVGFEIEEGLQNKQEKVRLYNEFVRSLDSSAAKKINYEEFVEDMTLYDVWVYEIKVFSTKQDVFGKVSKGFKETFSNDYSTYARQKKQELLKKKKQMIIESLKSIDELKQVYIQEIKQNPNNQNSLEQVDLLGIPISSRGNNEAKEIKLLELQITEQSKLSDLESQIIYNTHDLFVIISDFQNIGTKVNDIKTQMKIVFPVLALILYFLFVIISLLNRYLKNYE